jgi:SAM-dependent methyltransferase
MTQMPKMPDLPRVGIAYDNVALDYDHHLVRDLWVRRVLWRHFDRLFRPGDHVLDVGCGTGSDTMHLAARRVRVTSVDASAKMLDELRLKLKSAPSAALVDVRQGEINRLAPLLPVGLDGIISSFAALNTVDLTTFGKVAAQLLRPGGRLVCHMLSPGHLTGGGRGLRTRRRAEQPASLDENPEITVGGESLPHLVLPPRSTYGRFFSSDFLLRRSYGLGFLVPRGLEAHLPASVLDALGFLESVIGVLPPLGSLARFFVLDLERRR